jgi:hypothetical protein
MGEPYCPICKPDPRDMIKMTKETLKKIEFGGKDG